MLARRWPTAEGCITAVSAYPYEHGVQFAITYQFSVAEDGPYTGVCHSPTWFPGEDIRDVNTKFQVGQVVKIRFRPDDPSVNKLDASTWEELKTSIDDL